MKNRMLAFFALFMLTSSMYAQVNIDIVVFCNDGEKFTLILDGQRYNDVPSSRVKVTGLNKYKYESKVIYENKRLRDTDNPIIFYGNNQEFSFSLDRHGKKYKMEFVSSRWLDGYQPTASHNNTTTQTTTQTTQSTSGNSTSTNSTNTTSSGGSQPSNTISVNAGGMKIGMDEKGGIKVGSKEGNVTINTHDKSGNLGIGQGDKAININKVNKTGCYSPLNYNQFEPIKKNISGQSSDANKLTAAEALLPGNCFTTDQVKEIMQEFSGDEVKLEFAKKAYIYTNDLNNYSKLKSSLSKEDKQKELQEFIRSQK